MGGKPNSGTKPDKRLKANSPAKSKGILTKPAPKPKGGK